VPTISFTRKFIDSVSFSSRDVSSKSWESIGDFRDYESVEDKVHIPIYPIALVGLYLKRGKIDHITKVTYSGPIGSSIYTFSICAKSTTLTLDDFEGSL